MIQREWFSKLETENGSMNKIIQSDHAFKRHAEGHASGDTKEDDRGEYRLGSMGFTFTKGFQRI